MKATLRIRYNKSVHHLALHSRFRTFFFFLEIDVRIDARVRRVCSYQYNFLLFTQYLLPAHAKRVFISGGRYTRETYRSQRHDLKNNLESKYDEFVPAGTPEETFQDE